MGVIESEPARPRRRRRIGVHCHHLEVDLRPEGHDTVVRPHDLVLAPAGDVDAELFADETGPGLKILGRDDEVIE